MNRPSRSTTVFGLFLLVLASSSSAQRVQHPTETLESLQVLVNRASPGDIVFVPSGSLQREILIDKSITLIGEDPRPTIESLVLVGAGNKVTLANLRLVGFESDIPNDMIEELRLVDVSLLGDVELVARLYVEAVRVSVGRSPTQFLGGSSPHSELQEEQLDGFVTVGATKSAVFLDCDLWGISGEHVFTTDGADFLALGGRVLANDLELIESPHLGESLRLAWTVPGPFARLVGTTRTQAPLPVTDASAGFWHLAGGRWLDVSVAAPGEFAVFVPNDTALIGMTAAFQVIGHGKHISRPVTMLVLP